MKKSHRLSGIILIALILTVATFAFAAANVMPATSSAGDGTTVISGYTVTNVNYILDATDPGLINTVTFTISPVPPVTTGDVKIQLNTTWITCDFSASPVSCPVGGAVTAEDAVSLRVVAAD